MIKKILVGLGVLIAVLVVVVATRPSEFRITRSAKMAASPLAVFDQVNDFHKWEGWSPWAKMDPNAKNSFEGPASGVGAVFRWDGNDKVGVGSMTITESKPGEFIRIKLDFLKPMEGTSDTEFTFKAEGNETLMTWSMTGGNNFIGKAMCMVMNMEKMLGDTFEQGLTSIKMIVEGAGAKQAP